MNLLWGIRNLIGAWWCGVHDSLRLDSCVIFLLTSRTIRARFLNCFVINGLVFLGSVFFAESLVVPLLQALVSTDESPEVKDTANLVFFGLYQVRNYLKSTTVDAFRALSAGALCCWSSIEAAAVPWSPFSHPLSALGGFAI